jgi:hypothetical protein
MATDDLFPAPAIAILQRARYDPNAVRCYDGLSGSLRWLDEFPDGLTEACHAADSWAFRYLLGFRQSLIRGRPNETCSGPWRQLLQTCPSWPGFRPERNSSALLPELELESRRFLEEFEAFCDPRPQGSPDV